MEVYERILENCNVDVANVIDLSEEEFAMARRNGVGASDTAAILGLMEKFRTRDDVMLNKLSTEYTDEERKIGTLRNVKVGKMMEPFILEYAQKELGVTVHKPKDQFRMAEYPWLTINFDGVAMATGDICPIEAKYCSSRADRYWDFREMYKPAMLEIPSDQANNTKIQEIAAWHGVPDYYLVQLHQQILALGSSFGKLAVLRDKDWEYYMYHIPRYQSIINAIIVETNNFWNQIERQRINL